MQRLLDQAIRKPRDAEGSHPALRLGNVHPAHWLGDVGPGQQFGLDRRPVLLEVGFELGNADAIDTGRAFVLHHPLEGHASGCRVPPRLPSARLAASTPLSPANGSSRQPRRPRQRCRRSAPVLLPRWSLAATFLLSSTVRVFPPPTCGFPCSALRFVLTPTMTSADFWPSIPTPLDAGSTRQTARSPRVLRTHLHAYACRIYVVAFRASFGL
jgi:hypothetical protein